jgi:hypothetical protein
MHIPLHVVIGNVPHDGIFIHTTVSGGHKASELLNCPPIGQDRVIGAASPCHVAEIVID